MYNPYGLDIYDDDTFLIDSNERIHKRMEEYKNELLQKKEQEIHKRLEDFVNSLEYDEEGKPIIPVDEEGYYIIPMDDDGIPLVNVDEEGNLILEPPEMESDDSDYNESVPTEVSATAQEIIDNANMQAQQIIADAQQNAEDFIAKAQEEGRAAGYEDGKALAMEEIQSLQNELEIERQNLNNQLIEAQNAMEGELVDVICDVLERAFKIQFGDSKDIILHLVDNCLMNAGNSKTFIIRVSEKNHGFLLENKESLLARLGSDVILDIINDPLLDEDACMIEADGGVFNCGLDVQLDMLLKDLRMLSTS